MLSMLSCLSDQLASPCEQSCSCSRDHIGGSNDQVKDGIFVLDLSVIIISFLICMNDDYFVRLLSNQGHWQATERGHVNLRVALLLSSLVVRHPSVLKIRNDEVIQY